MKELPSTTIDSELSDNVDFSKMGIALPVHQYLNLDSIERISQVPSKEKMECDYHPIGLYQLRLRFSPAEKLFSQSFMTIIFLVLAISAFWV